MPSIARTIGRKNDAYKRVQDMRVGDSGWISSTDCEFTIDGRVEYVQSNAIIQDNRSPLYDVYIEKTGSLVYICDVTQMESLKKFLG